MANECFHVVDKVLFDHERLDVYNVSIEFVAWCGALLDGRLSKCRISATKQLDKASTSVPLNIAEGNGKPTNADRCKFFAIARGSALECAACLDVFVARGVLGEHDLRGGKILLKRVVGMLTKMMGRLGAFRSQPSQESAMSGSYA